MIRQNPLTKKNECMILARSFDKKNMILARSFNLILYHLSKVKAFNEKNENIDQFKFYGAG